MRRVCVSALGLASDVGGELPFELSPPVRLGCRAAWTVGRPPRSSAAGTRVGIVVVRVSPTMTELREDEPGGAEQGKEKDPNGQGNRHRAGGGPTACAAQREPGRDGTVIHGAAESSRAHAHRPHR